MKTNSLVLQHEVNGNENRRLQDPRNVTSFFGVCSDQRGYLQSQKSENHINSKMQTTFCQFLSVITLFGLNKVQVFRKNVEFNIDLAETLRDEYVSSSLNNRSDWTLSFDSLDCSRKLWSNSKSTYRWDSCNRRRRVWSTSINPFISEILHEAGSKKNSQQTWKAQVRFLRDRVSHQWLCRLETSCDDLIH